MRSLNEGDALKALSVARYLVATKGAPLPEIEEWQLRHSLPYQENNKLEKKLRSWLENKSLHQILLEFDCIETTKARRNGKNHSWTTGLTARDKLFLEKLGMKVG